MEPANFIDILWLIFLAYWFLNWKSVKPTQEMAWRQPRFRWTIAWVVILLLVASRFVFPANTLHFFTPVVTPSYTWELVGILITIIGLIIAIAARKTLADNWSSDVELKKDHKLITSGIYKYMRHPIYTGIILMGIGTIVTLESIYTVLFFTGMTLFLIYKMKKEEKLLLKHFSKEYPEYMKRTKALIPFIY